MRTVYTRYVTRCLPCASRSVRKLASLTERRCGPYGHGRLAREHSRGQGATAMIYLVYRMKLTARSRADLEAFWRWAKEREVWFFKDLPMVKSLRWYQSVIGDVY